MKILMLYGINCNISIWDNLKSNFINDEVDYVSYPHSLTEKVKNINELTDWVNNIYGRNEYDVIIGHSLGGLIGILLLEKNTNISKKIICIDTNFKPANEFYRNLMTDEHMKLFGDKVLSMLKEERKYSSLELIKSVQEDFDYSKNIINIKQDIYVFYGDRNNPDYSNKISDLNLSNEVLNKIKISFVKNACHMIMIENPNDLISQINEIIC